MKVDLSRLHLDLAKRSTCSKSAVPSKQIKSFLLLKSKVASYLAKCTIVARRNGIVVWKIHVFALSEKGPVDCFKGHPTLKRGVAIKNGLLSHTQTPCKNNWAMCPKTICNLYTHNASESSSHVFYHWTVFFFALCERSGLAVEAPLYNFKTSRDTATKITQNKIFSNV